MGRSFAAMHNDYLDPDLHNPDNVGEGSQCEATDYDGTDNQGRPCEREGVAEASDGRWLCERHLSKKPDHLKHKEGAE